LGVSLWIVPISFFPQKLLLLTFILVLFLNLLVVKKVGAEKLKAIYKLITYFERERNLQKPGIQALWANLGIFLSYLVFGKESTIVGVLLLAFGDAFAGLVGTLFGKKRVWGKSLEGSFAFFFSSFLVLLPIIGLRDALIIALVGTLVELLPLKLDDNLTLPLVGAFLHYLLKNF